MSTAPQNLTRRDVGTLDWLTLRECANEVGVTPGQVREWCIRWREGKPGGLPYAHFGAKPEHEAERVNYRIHREKWAEFKRDRAKEEQKEDRQARKWVDQALDYV